jgi:thiamine-phosphate diphosphorylase
VLDRDDERLAQMLLAHARVLQVRLKPRGSAASADASDIVRVARRARQLCTERGALLVVNDRVDIALAVGADGVHLGQTDLPLAAARAMAPQLIIGVSTHDPAQVRAARDGGADYLGFGPVFATATKANPDALQGLAGLRSAVVEAWPVPVVAIGGITTTDAAAVYAAGAAAVCAIGAVNDARDPERVAGVMASSQPIEIARDSKL